MLIIDNPAGGADGYYDLGPIIRGEWVDWVGHIVWKQSGGVVQIWKNDTLVHEDLDLQTIVDGQTAGGTIKLGIYYFMWKELSVVQTCLDAGITEREIFFDELRVTHGPDAYDVVRPR